MMSVLLNINFNWNMTLLSKVRLFVLLVWNFQRILFWFLIAICCTFIATKSVIALKTCLLLELINISGSFRKIPSIFVCKKKKSSFIRIAWQKVLFCKGFSESVPGRQDISYETILLFSGSQRPQVFYYSFQLI